MDIVITYVDGLDPLWQADYEKYAGRPVLEKRFRDWGFLRFLFRGIEAHIPFVRKVFLVVARESQVPSWVDRSKVNVVLHSDIIPEDFLPVFNSSSIEMFLHRIPGIDEEILYLNDDFYPMRDCTHETFFPGGKAVVGMSRQYVVAGNDFRYLVRNSDRMARRAAGRFRRLSYLRPQHICYALLKSRCDALYESSRDEIFRSVTRLRERPNFNIYMYLDYMHYLGCTVNSRQSKKHFSLSVAKLEEICGFILNPTKDFVCINDVRMSDEKFRKYQSGILAAFEKAFPEKSAYEL